eukprot:694863-Pyramimonas_sp.AAC.1
MDMGTVPRLIQMFFRLSAEGTFLGLQTKRVIASPIIDVVLSTMYIYLLAHSWQPDTARLIMNPDAYYLPSVSQAFSRSRRRFTTASCQASTSEV